MNDTPRVSNQDEILFALKQIIPEGRWRMFEIGAGGGHHAILFGANFAETQWVTSDVPQRQNAITKTLREAKLPNVHGPLVYEVGKDEWPTQKFNGAYASQVLQEIPWKAAKSLFKILGNRLRKGSQVIFVGPFKYDGAFESERHAASDAKLKERDPQLGIRSFEDVERAMVKAGFALRKDLVLTGNQHLLYFERLEHAQAD